MRLSVVIAAHNEAENIAPVVRGVRSALEAEPRVEEIEVIVVDDGSTDETGVRAQEAGAQLVTLRPNHGKGWALREGIKHTGGDWILFIDGDGQDDPAEIPKLLDGIADDVAMVNGSRFIGRLEKGAISVPNWFGNVAMTGLFDLLFSAKITDSQAGFRMIRGELARRLPLRGQEYEIETEMLAKVVGRGLRVVEVPVSRYARGGGETDFRRVRNGMRILGTMVKERVRVRTSLLEVNR